MVAKRADSVYVGGVTRAWLKIKTMAGREEMQIRLETWGHSTAQVTPPTLRVIRLQAWMSQGEQWQRWAQF